MALRVELVNNPYKQRLRILINGEAVSVYSNLEKYMDEPFCYWCDKIFDSIYEECNREDYQLYYSSRKEEMDIMERLAGNYIHCAQYSSSPLQRPTTLLERIKDLNSIVKESKISSDRILGKNLLFLIPESLQKFSEDLSGLEVKNAFCQINANTIFYSDYIKGRYNPDVIILISDGTNTQKNMERLGIAKGFVIEFGESKRFKNKLGEIFLYETTEDLLFETIFDCLLLSPLLELFSSCINSLPIDVKEKYGVRIEKLQSTDVLVMPIVEKTIIEEGTSSRLRFETDIEGYMIKSTDLHFAYSEQGIIRCNGILVEGLKEGKSTLNIFREGDLLPCANIDYTVIKRNRIRDLKFDDDNLVLGEGDRTKLNLIYLPEDADNVEKIEWESDNIQVATVDRNGNIFGKSSGNCIIRCYAERVSTSCRCIVKPHLKAIGVETNDLDLIYGQEKEIKITLSPENSVDDQIIISSMDMRIVNVVGRKLMAIGIGETCVVIQNREETVQNKINVHVMTEKDYNKAQKRKRSSDFKDGKRHGWLSKLFF